MFGRRGVPCFRGPHASEQPGAILKAAKAWHPVLDAAAFLRTADVPDALRAVDG
jgi:hypothetical protein